MSSLVHTFGGRQGAFWFYLIPVAVMAIVFWLFARDAPDSSSRRRFATALQR
jgi:nitrate/nitrite transporter NarK